MNNKNFSGIQELFYDNINNRFQTNIKGFIAFALNQYNEKYFTFESTELMEFCFKGEGKTTNQLNLIVSKTDSHPDLCDLTIRGWSNDSMELLKYLEGSLEAEYANELLENIDKGLLNHLPKKVKAGNEQVAMLQAGMLNMYLSYDHEKRPCITCGKLESIMPMVNKVYKEWRLEELTPDAYTLNLLKKAAHISVNNQFYRDNNPDNELFFETCHIYNVSDEKCVWKYNIKANNGFLPVELLPKLDNIFGLIQSTFTNKSYHRVEVNNMTKDFYVGDANG